ncbi:3488_t:CDS:2, partial [Cetraspora pellucida]
MKNQVEKEAVKNYPPPTIVNAIKEYAAEEFDLEDSIREFIKLDVEEFITFLKNKGYQVEHYEVFHQSTYEACHKVIDLDMKKRSDAEYAAFEFCTKQISVSGIDDEILTQ